MQLDPPAQVRTTLAFGTAQAVGRLQRQRGRRVVTKLRLVPTGGRIKIVDVVASAVGRGRMVADTDPPLGDR